MSLPDEVVAYENVPCSAGLAAKDVSYLKRLLRGALRLRVDGIVIRHTVGHVLLPSGRTLRIRSTKAPAASVISWAAYLDPRLGNLRMLGRATSASEESDVAVLVASLFLAELGRAVRALGLTHAYHRQHVDSVTVRGRIDFVRLVRRAGDASRLPCELWERQPDSSTMRLLAATLERIARDPVMRSAEPGLLHTLQIAFRDVTLDVDPLLLSGRTQPGRNEHAFGIALVLARLLLQEIGLGDGDRHAGISYLVRLDVLFERAVVRALQENGLQPRVKRQMHHERLDEAGDAGPGSAPMVLDAWCGGLAPSGVVIDAKYKSDISSANLHQMLAYCSMTGANTAILAVPADRVPDLRAYRFPRKSGGAVTVHIVEFDVGGRDVAAWRAAAQQFAQRVSDVRDVELGRVA